MTFQERYDQEETWFGRVMVMEIYHLAQTLHDKSWTLSKTAHDFNCSIGLVSENLKLANEIHENGNILKCSTRQEALRKIQTRRFA